MIALLSPAKTLEFGFSKEGLDCTTPELMDEAEYLAQKLKHFSAKKLSKLMSLSPALSELNYDRYQAWEAPHSDAARPCILAFRGDVYRGLDADNFNEEDLDFAQKHFRILSGLYGLLKPMDEILPYRLEMGTSLKVTPKKTNLYKFWGDTITETLNEALKESETDVVVNLASNEYFKAINPKALKARILTCTFKEKKGSDYKVVMTYAKLARGFMSRYIVLHRVTEIEDLKGFAEEAYSFNEKLSTEDEFVFTR